MCEGSLDMRIHDTDFLNLRSHGLDSDGSDFLQIHNSRISRKKNKIKL